MRSLFALALSSFVLVSLGCNGVESPGERDTPGGTSASAADEAPSEADAPTPQEPEPEPPAPEVEVAVLDGAAYEAVLPGTADLGGIFPGIEFTEKEPPETMDRGYLFPVCGEWPEPGSEGSEVGAIASWTTTDELAPAITQTTVVDVVGFEEEGDLDAAWEMATRLVEECGTYEVRGGKEWEARTPAGVPDLDDADVLVFLGSNTTGAGALTVIIVRRGPLVAQAQIGTVGMVATGTNIVSDVHDRFPTAEQIQRVGELLRSVVESLEGVVRLVGIPGHPSPIRSFHSLQGTYVRSGRGS